MEINDLIDNSVKSYLNSNNELKDVLREIIEEEYSSQINNYINNIIKEKVGKIANKYIEEEINKVLSGNIIVGDGWSKPKEYSFDEFVKNEIHNKLNDNWGIQSKMQEMIKASVKNKYDNFIKDNSTELSKMILKNITNI